MSIFDDLLKWGNKTEDAAAQGSGQGTTAQGSGQGDDATAQAQAANPISTEASDIIIPSEPQMPAVESPVVPNVIATDSTVNPSMEAVMPQNTQMQGPTQNIPLQTAPTPDHLAPIQEISTNPQAVLEANTPIPTTPIEQVNSEPSIVSLSPVSKNPSKPQEMQEPQISQTKQEEGWLFDMTQAAEENEIKSEVENSKPLDPIQAMTLEGFIHTSLESIESMMRDLDNEKVETEDKAAQYKQQKEDFAQKEQDAYEAITQIEKKKERVKRIQEYFRAQEKWETLKVSGSVEAGLTELSTKEAVKKTVEPKKPATRAKRSTKTRKTTRRKTTAKKETENTPLL